MRCNDSHFECRLVSLACGLTSVWGVSLSGMTREAHLFMSHIPQYAPRRASKRDFKAV